MNFVESLFVFLAISALFVLAGYLIGKMTKRVFTAVVLLVLVCSAPAALVANSLWRIRLFNRAAWHQAVVSRLIIWAVLTTLLVLAGYAIPRRRRIGLAAVGLLLLAQFTYGGNQWLDETHWLYSVQWHQVNGDRVRIGSWEFVVPYAWYEAPHECRRRKPLA